MEKEMQENIAYEMAMMAKYNRELREELAKKNEQIRDLNSYIEELRYDLESMKAKKNAEAEATLNENCDFNVEEGDRIVITWTSGDSHSIGEVYEVAKGRINGPWIMRNNNETYYNINLKKFNEDGTPKAGAGSVLSLKSNSVHWRKVDASTPLSKRIKVVDKVTEDRWGCMSKQFHYEFENLVNI